MTYTALKELAEKIAAGYVPTDEEMQAARETLELGPLLAFRQATEKLAAALAEVLPVLVEGICSLAPLLVSAGQLMADFDLERIEDCPNHRVVHLAKHARKYRTRKKNMHRAFRLLEKEVKQ